MRKSKILLIIYIWCQLWRLLWWVVFWMAGILLRGWAGYVFSMCVIFLSTFHIILAMFKLELITLLKLDWSICLFTEAGDWDFIYHFPKQNCLWILIICKTCPMIMKLNVVKNVLKKDYNYSIEACLKIYLGYRRDCASMSNRKSEPCQLQYNWLAILRMISLTWSQVKWV